MRTSHFSLKADAPPTDEQYANARLLLRLEGVKTLFYTSPVSFEQCDVADLSKDLKGPVYIVHPKHGYAAFHDFRTLVAHVEEDWTHTKWF